MTRYCVEHPVTLCMAVLACILFGVLVLADMDLAFTPDTRQPGLTILVQYPGVGAKEIDALLTVKLEEAVSRLPGVARILSMSSDGKSKIHLLYPYETRLETATMDVLDALAPVAAAFPRDMEKPQVLRYDPSDAPVFVVSCSGNNLPALRTWAERTLKPKFERVKGVSEVVIAGGESREIIVAVDRIQAAAQGISLREVAVAVQRGNAELPSGTLPSGGREILVRTEGRYTNLAELPLSGIWGDEGSSPLGRIATVFRAGKARDSVSLDGGKEQVAIYVKKGEMASLIGVTRALRDVYEAVSQPQSGSAVISYDASEPLRGAIRSLIEAGFLAACVTIFVLWFFLRRMRDTLLVTAAIPLSACVTFTLLGGLRIPLDMMTLSGLAVGIGMVVDNAVIVLSSIHGVTGQQPEAAAILGGRRVGMAIVASTVTTVCVFVPVLFLTPEMRLLFGHLAVAITCLLIASLVVALAVIPAGGARVLVKTGFIGTPGKTDLPHILRGLSSRVHGLVRFSGRRPLVIASAAGVLLVAGLVALSGMGKEIIAPFGSRTVFVSLEFPSGTNLERTTEVSADVSAILKQYAWIKKTESRVEKAHSVITVQLREEGGDVVSQESALKILTERFRQYRKAFIHLGGAGGSESGSARTVTMDVIAEDTRTAQEWARKAASRVGKIPGMEDVVLLFKEGSPELAIQVQRKQAALLGLTVQDIGMEVRSAIFGPVATKYIDEGHEVDVRVRHAGGTGLAPDKVGNIPISVGDGKTVPLASVASLEPGQGSTMIFRKDGRITASFRVRYSGMDLGTAIQRIEGALQGVALPEGVRFQPGDEVRELEASSSSGIFAVLIAVVLVYMVLASLYESYSLPFVVMLVVPVAGAASIVTLFVTGTALSIPVYLGLIMLAGLVVNNSIIIVDDAWHGVRTGIVAEAAVLAAVQRRLQPMLITTCTSVFGLVPLVFAGGDGASLYQPLAVTMLSGLTVGLIGSLVLVPAFFTRLVRQGSAKKAVEKYLAKQRKFEQNV